MPFRIDGLKGTLVEGKDDNEACRWGFALPLPPVPLVDGRYERTEVMAEKQERSHSVSEALKTETAFEKKSYSRLQSSGHFSVYGY